MTFSVQFQDDTGIMNQAEGLLETARGIWEDMDPSLLIGLAVALVVLFGATWMLQKLISGSGGRSRGSGDGLKEARRLKRQGDYQRAGELFEIAGSIDEAIEMYRLADAPRQLGHLYEVQRNWLGAAAAYQAARDYEKAGQMFQRGGQFLKAAELLEASGKESIAADLYEKARDNRNAARLYDRSGNLVKAGACYERDQQFAKAAEQYEKYYLQEMVRLNSPTSAASPEQRSQIATFAQTSGRLYLKVNEPTKAAKIWMLGGFTMDAAQAYLEQGDIQRAAELYEAGKLYTKAADLYRQLGNEAKAAQLLAEIHLENRDYKAAAELFARGGDFLQAGDLFERAGHLKQAGEMYLKAGDSTRAVEIFQASGDLALAAVALEQAGQPGAAARVHIKLNDFEKAAQLFDQAKDYYQAGMLFHRLGRAEDTIAFLQKVDTQSEDYSSASLLLGRLFMDRGMLDAARERYKKLISRKELTGEEILEPYYNLAMIYERHKEHQNALLLYEKILAENYNFKDVQSRIAAAKIAIKEEKSGNQRSAESGAPGRYRILRKLGQGGMGVVFLAEDTLLSRTIAYKVLPPSVKDNPKVMESFLQEARVAAAINHPNIVTVYDTGSDGDEPYIVMEYVDGMTLKEILEKSPSITTKDIVRIGRQLCQGLDYAHAKNVIHRDIKPANIMINKEFQVKIMDFGLAKVLSGTVQEGTGVKGTPLYMSPEQIKGTQIDHRSDLYSLGCTFYRMATGRPPFYEGDVYYHHLNTTPPSPQSVNPQIPTALSDLILRCLQKEPGKRYPKARDISADLERIPV